MVFYFIIVKPAGIATSFKSIINVCWHFCPPPVQNNYVHMRLIHVKMQHTYVDM